MNQNGKLHQQNDILNFWNFLEHLHLKVNVEKNSPYFPHSQQLPVYKDMIELPTKLERWIGPN
jgi:hypothetical protein